MKCVCVEQMKHFVTVKQKARMLRVPGWTQTWKTMKNPVPGKKPGSPMESNKLSKSQGNLGKL